MAEKEKSLLDEILEGLMKDREGVLENGSAKDLVSLDGKIARVKKEIDKAKPKKPDGDDEPPTVKKSWL